MIKTFVVTWKYKTKTESKQYNINVLARDTKEAILIGKAMLAMKYPNDFYSLNHRGKYTAVEIVRK